MEEIVDEICSTSKKCPPAPRNICLTGSSGAWHTCSNDSFRGSEFHEYMRSNRYTMCYCCGDQLIASRQTALTTLSGKVTTRQNQKQITSDQANVLQSDISTNQSGLAALKSKLDAETNPMSARLDVANIFFQFRIFAVVLPRDYRRLYFDVAQAAFPALTPANFNYNRSTYLATLSQLDTAENTIHNALRQAASDLHQIAQILKNQ